MPSWKTIFRIALITVGTMFVMNQLAGMNATARKLIRGSSVSVVPSNGTPNIMEI